MIAIVELTKEGGPLTKRITLDADGSLHSDGSTCVMSNGIARRVALSTLDAFADRITGLSPSQAIALGSLRSDLPDEVLVVTKDQLSKMNGSAGSNTIARTADHIAYAPGRPALALIDIDTKGMPDKVCARVHELGGFWLALISVVPELATVAHVTRRSTSTGISRTDTGEILTGSNGMHVFVLIQEGAEVERFLRTLHDRCWLHGLGWMMVGAGGQLLERSLVDRMVYAPERLVFEGPPVLGNPLVQDKALRRATAKDGLPLDTLTACPPLRIVEQANLDSLRAQDSARLAPDRAKSRETFITGQVARLAKRAAIAPEAARRVIERQCEGVLRSEVVLPFDSEDLRECTVADVLADPERFEGSTLADPLEGVVYGRGKAKIMRRADGAPWINSFAHGQTVYELRHSAESIRNILDTTADDLQVETFTRLMATADVADHEREQLGDRVASRTRIGKRTIKKGIEAETAKRDSQAKREMAERRIAERRDPRPQVPAPLMDAPWLPQMDALNDVLSASTAAEPPMRDLGGFVTQVRLRSAPNMHALTTAGANEGEAGHSRLPAPESPLLTRLDEVGLSELIERYIDYTDVTGRSVHLAAPFVRHYLDRSDGALPLVTSVATLPMVLPNGAILSGRGLDRDRGIVFRVPPEVQAYIPEAKTCTPTAVAEAMRFLIEEWLIDVATDYAGKCQVICAAATLLERHLLPERPAFFIQAGQRGGGKTTVAHMISHAALGTRAAAAAWSPADEERRKSLFAYLSEGVPLICWDNIPRGLAISCPSIEKCLTAATYTDRILGASESRTVSSTAVHLFTGNNIGPRGDMASRSLCIRLSVDRTDPENRSFKHPDPLAWTDAHRGEILGAIYTILLGNPRLFAAEVAQAETRFKLWWHLAGSAIENAARQHSAHVEALTFDQSKDCPPHPISFQTLFREGEAEEEQTSSLGTVLETVRSKWPSGFKASDVAIYAATADEGAFEFKAALEQASGKALKVITPTSVTWRLKAIVDAPVTMGSKTMVLRLVPSSSGHGGDFSVKEISR